MSKAAREKVMERLEAGDVPETARKVFLLHWDRVHEGTRGEIPEAEISPVDELPSFEDLGRFEASGRRSRNRVALIKLNGGLGTSMGLEKAKSLLPVRGDLTFLDLICRQALALRAVDGHQVPLLLMNSFSTESDSMAHIRAHYPTLLDAEIPLSFLQHRVPKIDAETLEPATSPDDPELAWCPPGHGDLYTAMVTSGVLQQLLDSGYRYAFVSNADNLGALIDDALLGYMVHEELPFVMEVAVRTEADRKGGHLCRLADGRLALREAAQVPEDDTEKDRFQDISRHRFFNTNNLWLDLEVLADTLRRHDRVLPLPTIVNSKTLDPRDPDSPPVYQLETAMGAAISEFPNAAAVQVARSRFSPVKTTDDLLAVSSDAYVLTEGSCVQLHESRLGPPTVELDPTHFKMIDDFLEHFPAGPPSLLRCEFLKVSGDVTFSAGIEARGEVHVHTSQPIVLPPGAVLEGDITHVD
jgi:UTP--glucose-1-phosphate uridylyltransferase